jgi:hypothetical protein
MQVATSGLHEDVYTRLSIRTTLEDLVSRLNRRDAAGTLRHLQEHSFRERDSGVAVSCLIGGQRGRDLTSCFSGVHPELIYSLPGKPKCSVLFSAYASFVPVSKAGISVV